MRTRRGTEFRIGVGLLAGGLAAVLALGGCSSEPEAEPAASDPVAGEWVDVDVGMLTAYDGGTWTVRGGDEGDPTVDGGTYTVDGDRLTMTTVYGGVFDVGSASCADGAVGVYDVTIAEGGSSMEMVLVSDECETRRNHRAGTFTKVE